MSNHRIFKTTFASVYPFYVQKAERKNRTKEEVDQIICWLTGYDRAGLQQQIDQENDFETFFAQAPGLHPNSALIKGVVCGVRVEEIEHGRDPRWSGRVEEDAGRVAFLRQPRPRRGVARTLLDHEGGVAAARMLAEAFQFLYPHRDP